MKPVDPHMQAALLACYVTPDAEFRQIAVAHGVDREQLQEEWFDLEEQRRAYRAREVCLPTTAPSRMAAHA
jgi:transposase-like protein